MQVYGGAISIMIGSYSYSISYSSTTQSGDTYCSGCTVNVSDVAITNSVANTTGKLWAALQVLKFRRCVCDCSCMLRWPLH